MYGVASGGDKSKAAEGENELYMGGIPTTMSETQVRQLCESFGMLKKFLL